MGTAAIYTRVSSKRQLEGNGLDDQLTLCRNYAAKHDLEITAELVDKGVTGATNKRPEFDKLRAMAGKVDAVIIPVHSRFSRAEDVLSTLTLMQEIEKAGTKIHVTNRGLVTTLTMTGMIIAVVDLYQATNERKELIEKVRNAQHSNARKGIIANTRHRFGYQFITKEAANGTQKLVIDLDEAEIVRDIFTWFAVAGPDGKKLSTSTTGVE